MKKILSIVFISAAMCISTWAACSESMRKELEALDRSWGEASITGNRNALMALYADDYQSVPDMQGKTAAIDAAMADFEAQKASGRPADRVDFDHYLITCTPSTATLTHRNTVWGPNGADGKPTKFYSRSVHFLEKRGGKWQVVSNAGGPLDDIAMIWYLDREWGTAVHDRNRGWFEENFADGFTSVSSTDGKLYSKSAEIASTMNDKGKVTFADSTDVNVRVDGNTAVVNGVFIVKGTDEKGVAYERRSRYTDTWIKRDGRWQAWATAGTFITN